MTELALYHPHNTVSLLKLMCEYTNIQCESPKKQKYGHDGDSGSSSSRSGSGTGKQSQGMILALSSSHIVLCLFSVWWSRPDRGVVSWWQWGWREGIVKCCLGMDYANK